MIQYDNTVPGIFLRRVNRFVAEVQIAWYGCQVETDWIKIIEVRTGDANSLKI